MGSTRSGAQPGARPEAQPGPSAAWPPAPSVPAPRPDGRPAPTPAWPVAPVVAAPTTRPSAVVWACALTWVFAGLALLVMVASIAVLATSPGLVFDEVHRQNPDFAAAGVSDATLRNATFVLGGIVAVWSLAAIVLAVLTFRGVNGARIALVVSASMSAACCLLVTLGQFLLVVPLAASVVTLALLVRPDVKAWYDAPERVRGAGRRP